MAAFTNQATLTYSGSSTNSNTVTGEVVQVLSADKNSLISEYIANDLLTYVISIVNSGTTDFTNLTVTDDLGAYTYGTITLVPMTYDAGSISFYLNGVLQTTPTVVSGPPLAISGIDVPAGSDALLIYRAALNSYAPLSVGDTIENTATITGSGVSQAITVTESGVASSAPYLSITKTLSPQSVVENGQITYTFVIENTGNTEADATDLVTLTDTFDPVLNGIAVTLNGATWAQPGNYTYDGTSGEFATVAGQITVPAATYTQDTTSGEWIITPGVTTLTVTGTV